ncbi:rhamnulokinase [Pseudobutyrivibrio xylanivorans]|uniref:Rhamnulokinase n=1 Tax=Pseudobutyrivibrio xylanivorans TaxID=185007 RepID=A0A5P6VSA4_PSEXY|nr:rhamnulokinase [Pseudobutyrivibrio xylanivorans]QFJ55340.1 rhamnulokinase [Pseudobutyrivibrio xylanivorans]
MGEFYLAVDIGASSGRHMLFTIEDGKILMDEIYRFENGMKSVDGKLLWDTKSLFEEIKNGMKKCSEMGRIPVSMSIDTWGVDYVLLDEDGNLTGDTFGYRDHRTNGMDAEVYKVIPEDELYKRIGIQKAIFNTIYQLTADRIQRPEALANAKTLLMIPDYLNFLLTGNKASEYTNATTTGLVNPATKQWDYELIEMLGFPKEIFLELKLPGNEVGQLSNQVTEEVGFSCKVLQCASHDTASAVMSMPHLGDEGLYISSGTWSLMGVENKNVLSRDCDRQGNFTNEGGYDYRYRYLKNIMGLWMIQQVRHEANDALSFAEYAELASRAKSFPSLVDANDERFLSPRNMTEEIKKACEESRQQVPGTSGELAAVIYKSLAKCYGNTITEIRSNTGRDYEALHIIGGGCKNAYLNQLTADATGLVVLAGPSEATAIGNAMVQMIEAGELADLVSARECVRESFNIEIFNPQNN